jgi:hypothetical protein
LIDGAGHIKAAFELLFFMAGPCRGARCRIGACTGALYIETGYYKSKAGFFVSVRKKA